MICDKCKEEFPERKLELSHDIPKYLGGLDSDGRRYLCSNCHKNYENEVLKVVMMNFLKTQPEHTKTKLRGYARLVRSYFFKKEVKEDDTQAT